MTDQREYFAEGLQSYFNNHIEGPSPSNGVHGPINTNSELRSYDPGLYQLIKELYPCGNTYHWCKDKVTGADFRINCDGTNPITQKPVVTNPPSKSTTEDPIPPIITTTQAPTTNCKNNNSNCKAWARYGYCTINTYVKNHCKLACGVC